MDEKELELEEEIKKDKIVYHIDMFGEYKQYIPTTQENFNAKCDYYY